MVTKTYFTQLIHRILPLQYQQYLKGKNWRLIQSIGDVASRWETSSQQYDTIQILLPLDTTFTDYNLRMAEFIETLHVAEGRSYESIVTDLKNIKE